MEPSHASAGLLPPSPVPDVWIPPGPNVHQHNCEGLEQDNMKICGDAVNFEVIMYLSEEEKVDEECKGYHGKSSKQEHHHKVGRLSSEATLLQHSAKGGDDQNKVDDDLDKGENDTEDIADDAPAVAVGEDHVEEEVEAKGAKEEEGGDEPPDLVLPIGRERLWFKSW